ncbi:hypothetical protein C8R45DRAFT_938165 [Mycena sanguinolenta]|nr:hypothetical protein C8R45DRAFT_938165 [Mycena sanguinolenta]
MYSRPSLGTWSTLSRTARNVRGFYVSTWAVKLKTDSSLDILRSAGTGSVRALLGSPPAFGLFSGAIAQSNLAGFTANCKTLERFRKNFTLLSDIAYGAPVHAVSCSTYSEYFTIEQEVQVAAGAFVEEVGCGNGTAADIRRRGWKIHTAGPKRDHLSVDGKGPIASNAHVIFGWMAGDGADFAGSFPQSTTTQTLSIEGIPVAANLTTTILGSGLFPRPSTGNETLDTFNVTARVATDGEFVCLDQATAHSASLHKVFKSVWTYQFDRSYGGYEPIPGICDPPITATHPFGDPSLPYFQCHSGELNFNFGNLGQANLPFRDEFDLPFEQVTANAWTSFARTPTRLSSPRAGTQPRQRRFGSGARGRT